MRGGWRSAREAKRVTSEERGGGERPVDGASDLDAADSGALNAVRSG